MALTRRCTNVVQGWGSCCSRSAAIVDQKVRCFRGVNRSISLQGVQIDLEGVQFWLEETVMKAPANNEDKGVKIISGHCRYKFIPKE